jgi:hypothetical protein
MAFTFVSTSIALLAVLTSGSEWFEALILPKATVICREFKDTNVRFPSCNLWGTLVVPTTTIEDVHIVATFGASPHDTTVTSGLAPGPNYRIDADPVVQSPCDFSDKGSMPNQDLAVQFSGDHRQVTIHGEEVTPFDGFGFVASFYPAPSSSEFFNEISLSGEASINAFGHSLPARIILIDLNNKASELKPNSN